MNQILVKFIKKIEKIQKYKIIHRDDDNVLFMIPITIDLTIEFKNIESFNPLISQQPREVSTIALCTTNAKSVLAIACKKAKILVGELSEKSLKRTLEETEEFLEGATIQHYDLKTKIGNGHQ